jgi:cell division septation protein DedD
VVAVTAVVWLGPAGAKAARRPRRAPRIVDGPPIATGASFSVHVTSFSRDADARVMAGGSRRRAAVVRLAAGRSLRDVLVGPFVSIDEAEAAQRDVASWDIRAAACHVDERLRATSDGAAAVSKGEPGGSARGRAGTAGRGFRARAEPQQVSGQRIDATTFAVTTSASGPIETRRSGTPRPTCSSCST